MMTVFLFRSVVALAFLLTVSSRGDLSKNKKSVPRYVVNLDDKPENRWNEVVRDYKPLIRMAIKVARSKIPSFVRGMITNFLGDLRTFKAEYADEMRGIAKAVGLPLSDAVITILYYELQSLCTSIIVRDKKGQIWHARNMDFDFTTALQQLTIHVDFQRNQKTVYSGVVFAGLIGVDTGQKPNTFTVSVNQRYDRNGQIGLMSTLLVGIFEFLKNKVQPMSLVVREALDTSQTYREAVLLLSDRVTMAPVYYIVGGVKPNEGVVISKGRLVYDNLQSLKNDTWFLVQTNSDHFDGHYGDRYFTAINGVKKMGQNGVTVTSLFNVMSTPRVLNERTVYQTVMSASEPQLMTTRLGDYDATKTNHALKIVNNLVNETLADYFFSSDRNFY